MGRRTLTTTSQSDGTRDFLVTCKKGPYDDHVSGLMRNGSVQNTEHIHIIIYYYR